MGQKVQIGLECLVGEKLAELKGRKVALCCNPTSVDSSFRHIVDILHEEEDVDLVALFGPEHGIRGEAQDMIGVAEKSIDAQTGLPIYSLYGDSEASLRPTPEMMEGIDVVLFDIQDVGSRYYTYIYTMSFLMEAAAKIDAEVWILDRPNPIGGHLVEGPILEDAYRSFVGCFPILPRHGMTAGELALMFRGEFGIDCKLEVIKMQGWERSMWMDQTDAPWVLPSPNMPTLDTATVYPGGCLFEGTNLSEARGATKPFELVGAPYIDPFALGETLEAMDLPGVVFRPLRFSPTFHKWAHESCGGVQIHVTDREVFRPFLTGVAILHACYKVAPDDFKWRTEMYEFVSDRLAIDLLCGSTKIREAIEAQIPIREIEATWLADQSSFLKQRASYLLY